jgi:hypothetical protein
MKNEKKMLTPSARRLGGFPFFENSAPRLAAASTLTFALLALPPRSPRRGILPEPYLQNGAPSAAPSCSDDCNHKASDCIDGCEEKFKDDDKARVTCKFECATKRQQCEKNCN